MTKVEGKIYCTRGIEVKMLPLLVETNICTLLRFDEFIFKTNCYLLITTSNALQFFKDKSHVTIAFSQLLE